MTNNEVWIILIGVIETGLTDMSINASVQQDYQPTQQGAPSSPFVALHNITNSRYGFNKNKTVYDADDDNLKQTQGVVMQRTYQVSAYAIEDPSDDEAVTAYDIVEAVSSIMQSEKTQDTLLASGISIFRVTDIRSPFFTDDKDRNEAAPSFDFVISYSQETITAANEVTTFEEGIHSV
jgi:hypothetical protein